MTQIAIQTQIDAIIKATKDAVKSKESAIKFLEEAGIIKPQPTKPNEFSTENNQKIN
jgi:hypothetical protein